MKNFLKSSLVIFVLLIILGAAFLGYRKYANKDEKTVLNGLENMDIFQKEYGHI